MTFKIPGGPLVIAAEKDKTCGTCGKAAECRPYGKGGKQICFDCMMSTPEAQAEAKARFNKRMG